MFFLFLMYFAIKTKTRPTTNKIIIGVISYDDGTTLRYTCSPSTFRKNEEIQIITSLTNSNGNNCTTIANAVNTKQI